jgi:hypothetical protein
VKAAACTFIDWLSKQQADTAKDLRKKDLNFINVVLSRGDLWRRFQYALVFLCDYFVERRCMFQARHAKPIVIENSNIEPEMSRSISC